MRPDSGEPDAIGRLFTDAELISRSRTDPEQFAVLFRRHAPAIQRYVIRRIGPHAADDVVAETFLAAFRQRAAYRQDTPDALPWLYGIATNMVRRHWRTEVQQLRLLARTGVDPVLADFTQRVDETVSAAGANAALAAGLAQLPAVQRDALLLVAWGGLTYEQVAAATGAPLGTVQSRISRARRRLRAALAAEIPAPAFPRERRREPALHPVTAQPAVRGDLR
jgi:RNA polymerase sigma-70 factor, ECF subfamily